MKRFPYKTNSAAEWLQEALQKSCTSAGLQQSQILVAVESPLTAIKALLQQCRKFPHHNLGCKVRQSGFEKNVVTGNGLPLVSTKKRNVGSNNTIILIHGRGVDKALVAE